jgi:hypothetical protein
MANVKNLFALLSLTAVAVPFIYWFAVHLLVTVPSNPHVYDPNLVWLLRVSLLVSLCSALAGGIFAALGLKWKRLPIWLAVSCVSLSVVYMAMTIGLVLDTPWFGK